MQGKRKLLKSIFITVCFFYSGVIFAKGVDIYIIIRSNLKLSQVDSILNIPYIKGVTVYYGWKKVNPAPDEFNFDAIEEIIKLAAAKNKKVNIGILTGRWSPDWLAQKNTSYMNWSHTDSYTEDGKSREEKAPVPWDSTYKKFLFEMLSGFKKMISKYSDTINSLSIVGGSNTNGIEANLICTEKELARIQFTEDIYIKNWESIIEFYRQEFPSINLTFAIHNIYGAHRTELISEKLEHYINGQPGTIYISSLAFTEENWFAKGNHYADLLLKEPSDKIMLQCLRQYHSDVNYPSFISMLHKANSISPKWLEIWAEDLSLLNKAKNELNLN